MSAERHILIIEDNPGDVRLMREALRELQPPVVIHVATDTSEALECLQQAEQWRDGQRLHLIFLDFNLPKSDSRQLLKQIKEHEHWRLIPLAVLTTSDAARDVRDAYELYANCYLRKPLDLDGFFNTIRQATRFWLDISYSPGDVREQAEEGLHLL
ncbi:MAG: response regulator [Acidobacteriaceae bacterium]|nr:response regulator [Acidobacteriaceae bacterium]